MKRYTLYACNYNDSGPSHLPDTALQKCDNLIEIDLTVLKPIALNLGLPEWFIFDNLFQRTDRKGKF